MFTEEHLQLFTSFRVRTFGLKIQEMLDDPDYDDVSFEHKIVEAIEAEQLARTNRKIEKYLKAAGFKNPEASVEDIHYHPDRALSRERITRLAKLAWIDEAAQRGHHRCHRRRQELPGPSLGHACLSQPALRGLLATIRTGHPA